MTGEGVDIAAITVRRLGDWGRDCIRDHATPVLLVAIGHDETSGETHIYVPDDPMFTQRTVAALLRVAIRELNQ